MQRGLNLALATAAAVLAVTVMHASAAATIGDIKAIARNYVLSDQEFCHGQLVSVFKFPHLFAQIGFTYGGDGRNFFRLPDLRGKTIVSANTTAEVGSTRTSNDALVTLGRQQLPPHSQLTTPLEAASAGVSTRGFSTCTERDSGCVDVYPSRLTGASADKAPDGVRVPGLGLNFAISTRGVWPQAPRESRYPGPESSTRPSESATASGPVAIVTSATSTARLGHLAVANKTVVFEERRDIDAAFAAALGFDVEGTGTLDVDGSYTLVGSSSSAAQTISQDQLPPTVTVEEGSGNPASIASLGSSASTGATEGPGVVVAAHLGLVDDSSYDVGDVVAFPVTTPTDSNWAPCDGRALSKTSNNSLYAAIGDAFGSNTTHFRLPDLSDRAIYGAYHSDTSGTNRPPFGATLEAAPRLGWNDVPGFDTGNLPGAISLKSCSNTTSGACTELLNPTPSTLSHRAAASLDQLLVRPTKFYMFTGGTAPEPSQCADGYYSNSVDPFCSLTVESAVNVTVEGHTLSPAFDSNVTSYRVNFSQLQETVTINVAIPPGATVSGDGTIAVLGGPAQMTQHTITITTSDTLSLQYSITFAQPYICGAANVIAGERSQEVQVDSSTVSFNSPSITKTASCPDGTVGVLNVTCSSTNTDWRVAHDTCALPDCIGGNVKSKRVRVTLPPALVGDTATANCPSGMRGRLTFECRQVHMRRAGYRRTSGRCTFCGPPRQDVTGSACATACQRQYNAASRYTLIDENPSTGCKGRCVCILR